jgi:low temperature requirement protein LtrA
MENPGPVSGHQQDVLSGGMSQGEPQRTARRVESEQRVTPLELFFDLVFVFAITQVTGFLARDPTWLGLLRGLMLLAALWWAWAAYAWLTNTLNPEEGAVRLAVFGSIASMLIVSLAVPNAFGVDGVTSAWPISSCGSCTSSCTSSPARAIAS